LIARQANAGTAPERDAGAHTWPAGVACAAALVAIALLAGRPAIAVYGLSFWHYALYAAAYRYGAVPLDAFKRDAVAMKTLALAALGAAYLSAPLDAASLALVAAGFALNAYAASVLGTDRTYYGREVAGLAPLRVTAFPFSVIAHPMLAGNIAAYAGTLLNPAFRAEWWPLAVAHVALNLGLLWMETGLTPLHRRRRARPAAAAAAFVAGGACAGAAVGALVSPHLAAALGCAGAYAGLVWTRYVPPPDREPGESS
jgi:protein-S-isoprenylcysteine O-methyltransferase Ste14